jgi:PLP dependent protein
MNGVAARYKDIRRRVAAAARAVGREPDAVTLVAVSKTFGETEILPVIEAGQLVFGENRVQEAQSKWPALRQRFPGLQLHLIGPLQSNKVKDAVALFEVIESVDRDKIARAIGDELAKQDRRLEIYVQVNTGAEPQKSGIAPQETVSFVARCRTEYGLAVSGLMCIPPLDEDPGPHFALLAKLAGECGVEKLSMGMSADFETAVEMGATHVRVGSAIFGER